MAERTITQTEYYRPLLQAIMSEASPNRWRNLTKEEVKKEICEIIDDHWSSQKTWGGEFDIDDLIDYAKFNRATDNDNDDDDEW